MGEPVGTWECSKCGTIFPRHTKVLPPENMMCSQCQLLESVDILVEKYLPFLEKLLKKYDKLIEEHKPPEHECKGKHFGDGIARHMWNGSGGEITQTWSGWHMRMGAVTISISHCPFCGEELK